ncbi:hypothetical protein TorRG33x02_128120, partial [Trema orientale]
MVCTLVVSGSGGWRKQRPAPELEPGARCFWVDFDEGARRDTDGNDGGMVSDEDENVRVLVAVSMG